MHARYRFFIIALLFLVIGLGSCKDGKATHSFGMERISGKSNVVPVLVVGSGPAGLMAATYGARGGKETFLVEGNKPGGLLMDTTEVANWPGETMIQGPEIIEKLRGQATHHNVHFISDQVESIDTSHWPYRVQLENGDILHALTIVIATGASPRKLHVPGEEKYWGSGVTSCAVCDAPFFKNEEVVVVGGGDSAAEEAIQLSPFARKITILVRKEQMRAAQSMQDRLKAYPKISVRYNVEVKKIVGDLENVTGVELYDTTTTKNELFPASGVFLAIGHIPNSRFLKNVITTDGEGYIKMYNNRRTTSVPGIFAAGDIADRIYRQAGTSAGSGIEAGLDAVQFLDDHGFSNHVAAQIQSQVYNPTAVRSESELIELNSNEDLQKIIANNSDKLVVIDFWTETCSSCKQMLPSFKQAAAEFSDNMIFLSIDADEASEIADAYSIMKVPTIIVLKKGEILDQHVGFLPLPELFEYLKKQPLEA